MKLNKEKSIKVGKKATSKTNESLRNWKQKKERILIKK